MNKDGEIVVQPVKSGFCRLRLLEIVRFMLPSEFMTYFKITKVESSSEKVWIRLALKI
jgi:hypothetical protein